tara:strand:+ start:923 stop:1168 length:246 start_codon:yes stop_codon:yes gene_type:complete
MTIIHLTPNQSKLVETMEAGYRDFHSVYRCEDRDEAAYRIVRAKLELGFGKADIDDRQWTGARKHHNRLRVAAAEKKGATQ